MEKAQAADHPVTVVEGNNPNQEEQKPQERTTFDKIKLIAGVIGTLISIGMAISSFAILWGYTQDLATVSNQWKKQPVVDMAFVSTSPASPGACPASYTAIDQVGRWGGAQAFCDYSTNSTLLQPARKLSSILGRACLANETAVGATTRPAAAAITLDSWRGYKICVKRGGIEAVERPILAPASLSSMSCPVGYKLCGQNSTVAPDWRSSTATCQPVSLPGCPSTDMQLINSTSLPPLPNTPTIAYTGMTSLNNSITYYYSLNSTAGLPVVDLFMTEGMPCQFLEKPGTAGRADQRPNVLESTATGCKTDDARFQVWDRQKESALFSANGVNNYYITNCTASAKCSGTIDWLLTFRREILWKAECPSTRKSVVGNVDSVLAVTKSQLALLVITIIFGIILGIWYPVREFKNPRLATDPEFVRQTSYIKIAARLCKIIPCAIALAIANGIYLFYQAISKFDCSDTITNGTFDFLSENLTKIASLNGAFIALDIAMSVYVLYSLVKFLRNLNKPMPFVSDAEAPPLPPPSTTPSAPKMFLVEAEDGQLDDAPRAPPPPGFVLSESPMVPRAPSAAERPEASRPFVTAAKEHSEQEHKEKKKKEEDSDDDEEKKKKKKEKKEKQKPQEDADEEEKKRKNNAPAHPMDSAAAPPYPMPSSDAPAHPMADGAPAHPFG